MAWEAPFCKKYQNRCTLVSSHGYLLCLYLWNYRISISIFHLLISLRYSVFHCVGFIVDLIESGSNVDQKHWLLLTSFLSYRYGTCEKRLVDPLLVLFSSSSDSSINPLAYRTRCLHRLRQFSITKYVHTYVYIIYLEYHSACPLVRIGTPHPLFRKRVCPLPRHQTQTN